MIIIFIIAANVPVTGVWSAVVNVMTSLASSALFAIISFLYITHCFTDPSQLTTGAVVLPQDIRDAIEKIARSATNYIIFVRTGRHFRAEILPIILDEAKKHRRPIRIEVILLDCRDKAICEKYATYRKVASFDHHNWTQEYVQTEIMATIHSVIERSRSGGDLIRFEIYLSKRLSVFRIEGSPEEIIVTREDPKDNAYRYRRTHSEHGAYLYDFNWIKEDACFLVSSESSGEVSIESIFAGDEGLQRLGKDAKKASSAKSPYVR